MPPKRRLFSKEEVEQFILADMPSDSDTPIEDSSSDEEYNITPDQNFQLDTDDNPTTSSSNVSRPAHGMSDSSSVDCSGDEENISPSTIQRDFRQRDIETTVPIFTLNTGAVESFFQNKNTPTDVFLTIVDEHILEDILFQSNLYIQQKEKIKVKPILLQELYAFLGIQFLFGYHYVPQSRQYWSSDVDLAVPVIPYTMARDRFEQILSNLHVNDNTAIPENNKDRLYKIRPLIRDINSNFQKLRHPDQYQSIDESMVLFKGRSTIKQYNPMKPIKRGYKLWCRSDMSGYIYEFDVYQGKTDDDTAKKEFGLGGSVVLKLTASLKDKNHIVMMDNFFSSIPLYEKLKSNNIYACGTIRPNRIGLPKMTADKDLKRGDYDFKITSQGIAFFKWRDNRCVHLLSNYHGSDHTSVKRTQKDGTKLDISAPIIVRDYNAHMGGVDKADMLRSFYDRNRKAKKWWHRLFFSILEISVVNAYVIYCDMNEKVSFLQFKRQVTQGLLTMGKTVPKKRGRPSGGMPTPPSCSSNKRRKAAFSVSKDIRLQNRGAHWPEFVAQRARCEMCSSKKTESRPHSRCSHCKVFLCVNEKKNCFYEYHSD